VPYYDKTLCPGGICNFTALDAIVAAATAHSMKIIIDHHANEGVDGSSGCLSQQANGLWYDVNSATVIGGVAWNTLTTNQDGCGTAGTVTYAQFKANWVAVATHYAGNQTVIGFDLDNEPLHGAALQATAGNWGGNNGSDARLMCNDTGAAVETAAPGALIICEGLINFTTTFTNGTAMSVSGGAGAKGIMDLSQAASLPVNGTGLASHVVYSIHDYPNDISAMVPDSGPSSVAFRSAAWGYLVINGTAPVWIGEMGADLDGTNGATNLAGEQAWASTLTQYMNGSQSGNGGPSFTGCQEPIGGDWWNFGNNSGQSPNGTLNADGTNRAGQQTYWSTILYTTCGNNVVPVTWNPNDQAGMTITGSNLITTNGSGPSSVRSTTSVPVGKVCWETTANTISADWDVGLANSSYVLTSANGLGGDTNGVGFDPNSTGGFQGTFYANGVVGSTGAGGSANGDVVTQCADLTAQLIWSTDTVIRNAGNTWNNSPTANPATGVGGISFSGLTGPYFITYNNQQAAGQATLNATGPFAVATPAGFAPFQATTTPTSSGKIIVINLAN
jgi:endoglucanase/chitinase